MIYITEKQKRFADEYLIDCNATRAYKTAYPDVKTDNAARTNASKLLDNVNVKKYIDERLKIIHDKKTADAAEIIEYLTSVMRGESTSAVLAACGDGCQEIINKPPDGRERLRAAELLGKRYGLFTEKMNVTGNTPVIIVDDIPTFVNDGSDGDGNG